MPDQPNGEPSLARCGRHDVAGLDIAAIPAAKGRIIVKAEVLHGIWAAILTTVLFARHKDMVATADIQLPGSIAEVQPISALICLVLPVINDVCMLPVVGEAISPGHQDGPNGFRTSGIADRYPGPGDHASFLRISGQFGVCLRYFKEHGNGTGHNGCGRAG